jgi:hypothetical protein
MREEQRMSIFSRLLKRGAEEAGSASPEAPDANVRISLKRRRADRDDARTSIKPAQPSVAPVSNIEESDETPPRHRILTVMCHDRFCTPCARRRAFKIQECVKMHIKGRRCRFMTLTLKGDKKAKLSDTIDRLYTGFRYLRSHPIWDGVDGGAAMLELKYNDKNHHWHPHLHILVEGRFLPQAELSDAWRSITKDSHIVDIRDARDDGAASYVAKYATKPLSTSYCHIPELLDECIEAIKGRRMILTFGTWYGTRLTEIEGEDLMDDEDFGVKWSMVCDVSHAIDQAIAGNDHYEKILRSAPGGYERLVAHMATGP